MSEKVDLVMVVYNTGRMVRDAVNSIMQTDYDDFHLYIVDNSSTDNSFEEIQKVTARWKDRITAVKTSKNLGYGAGCNLGAKLGDAKYTIFMNGDIFLHQDCPDWITPLVTALKEEDVVIAGPKLVSPDGKIMAACVRGTNREMDMDYYWQKPDDGSFDKPENCLTLAGAVFAVDMEFFTKWGGFDENYFLYYEETDLAYRARHEGFHVRYVPSSKLIHLHQQSEPDGNVLANYAAESKNYFDFKWQAFLLDGTYYGGEEG